MKQLLQILISTKNRIKFLFSVSGLFMSSSVWSQLPAAKHIPEKLKDGWISFPRKINYQNSEISYTIIQYTYDKNDFWISTN